MVSSLRAAQRSRSSHKARLTLALLGSAGLVFALTGCDERSDDVREWRPSDHDRAGEAPQGAQAPSAPGSPPNAPPPGMPSLQALGISDVTLAAWKQNCVVCHGLIGRGDGPQGPMLRPTDLTSPEWHERVSDEQIKSSIKRGRGRMPPFPQLPEETVDGLVKFVRLLNSERPAEPAPGATPAPATPAPATPAPATPAPATPAPATTAPATTGAPKSAAPSGATPGSASSAPPAATTP